MSSVECRTILRYNLMIPLFSIDEVCPIFHRVCLDIFGEHVVHCKELPGFMSRCDFVRDVLFDIFRRVGVSVKKEALMNFPTNPLDRRSTLRPADVMVYGWVERKYACVDLIEVSTLAGLEVGTFFGWTDCPKSCVKQKGKHDRAYSDNQHAFIPLVLDTFGFLAPEVVDLLHRV